MRINEEVLITLLLFKQKTICCRGNGIEVSDFKITNKFVSRDYKGYQWIFVV